MTNSGHTVLIVEDDASMRRAMERLLGTTGFVVLGYVSAEAVLAASRIPTTQPRAESIRMFMKSPWGRTPAELTVGLS